MKTLTSLYPWQESFIRLFYPCACAYCHQSLTLEEKNLCLVCLENFKAERFSMDQMHLCARRGLIDSIWNLYPYEGMVQALLTQIKFHKERSLLRLFENDLKDFFETILTDQHYQGLVPLPMDPWKKIDREFNLPDLIAAALCRHSRIPIRPLLKKKPSLSQSSLDRQERLINPYGLFDLSSKGSLNNASLLLIDDVYTTGATTQEACRILKLAGAKTVDIFTLARTKAIHEST